MFKVRNYLSVKLGEWSERLKPPPNASDSPPPSYASINKIGRPVDHCFTTNKIKYSLGVVFITRVLKLLFCLRIASDITQSNKSYVTPKILNIMRSTHS